MITSNTVSFSNILFSCEIYELVMIAHCTCGHKKQDEKEKDIL